MAYEHAERTLATIWLLETETAALLRALPSLDAEQLPGCTASMAAAMERTSPNAGPRPGPFAAGPEPFTAEDHRRSPPRR